MDLKQLRYFISVVNEQSFSEAARQIHIAQPALTRQVKALEEDLGVILLIRKSRGIKLTAIGQIFYEDALQILEQVARSKQKIHLINDGHTGELIIGITVMHLWIEEISNFLTIFRQKFPEVMLKINTVLSGPQVNSLQRGQLDLGVMYFPPYDSRLNSIKVYDDKLVLVTRVCSKLAKLKPKKLSDIGKSRFVWFDRKDSVSYHDNLIDHFSKNNFFPNIVERGSDNGAMLSLAASGVGCTIVPKAITLNLPSSLIVIELDDLNLPLEMRLVWRKDLTNPAVKNFVNVAINFFKKR
ncbi:LysR family transcriptional regulator [Psychromonas sp. L1A2]|uniref:LysR family transcriptional regulator n=1 Tax=Psychromonas sp. L1A2 TaxID=2686356 RepID=UPI00135B2C27|nr:LysR family transcriptional regulator [Psychromonas sp. L1A2]